MARGAYKDPENPYLLSRQKAGFTSRAAAMAGGMDKVVCDRTLDKIEAGQNEPSCSVVAKMAELYNDPLLPALYRQHNCPFKNSLVVLQNIDYSLPCVTIKVQKHVNMLKQMMPQVMDILVNRSSWEDYSPEERQIIQAASLEMLNVKHGINIYFTALEKYTNTEVYCDIHNQQCYESGYVDKRKAACVGSQTASVG